MTCGKRKCLVCFRFVLTTESQELVHPFSFFWGGGGKGVFNKIIIPIANVGYDCGEVAVRRDQWKCNWGRWKEGWTEKSTLGLSSQIIKK